jgi:hypothetical protein
MHRRLFHVGHLFFISDLILALLVPTIWACGRLGVERVPSGRSLAGFRRVRSDHAGPLVRRAHARPRKQRSPGEELRPLARAPGLRSGLPGTHWDSGMNEVSCLHRPHFRTRQTSTCRTLLRRLVLLPDLRAVPTQINVRRVESKGVLQMNRRPGDAAMP